MTSKTLVRIVLVAVALISFRVNGDDVPDRDPDATYQRVTERKLINGDKLVELKLKNGLRVLLVPRHQAKVLTYQTWFDVGSLNEKLDPKLKKTGLAHLFEHMMFRGSEKYPDGKFDEITARIGGDKQNASTHFYRTNYYQSVPSNQIDAIMELESDRMRNLKLTLEIFEKEKGAVVGEFRRHMDSPTSVASDELMKLIFKESPFQFKVLGEEAEIKGFTLAEAQYFYKTFYAPNNATLIIIGDVDEKPLMELVVKYYGAMTPQDIPRVPVPMEPTQKAERRFEGTHPQASSETLLVGYHAPAVDQPDAVPFSLLQTHLSRGTEARLRKILVDTGVAVSAGASMSAKPDLFEFYIILAEGKKSSQALSILDAEIKSVQAKKISPDSFERALNQELLNLYGDISDNSELGNWLGEYLMLCGNYMRGFEIIDEYKKLSPADLQRVAKQYLKREARSIVVLRPEKRAE